MIGIFGGSFDPIHHGHLRTALDVQQALGLAELRLIPLRDPPHRTPLATSPEQRLEMLRAAVAGVSELTVDQRELERSGKSYTLYTLQSLRAELGEASICLILGYDAFLGFPNWHGPEEILALAHLVIMQRPGESGQLPYPERRVTDPHSLNSSMAGKVYLQPVTQLDISGTRIREMLRLGQSPRYLLPDAVLEIIERDGLYRT
ncbi:MAG: nicotinate-nucleotide adenylyltransferase [Gammaproteobacteria bacterium]